MSDNISMQGNSLTSQPQRQANAERSYQRTRMATRQNSGTAGVKSQPAARLPLETPPARQRRQTRPRAITTRSSKCLVV